MIQYKQSSIKYCIALIMLLSACSYRIYKNEHGEPVMTKNLYTFQKSMTADDAALLDTIALYLQIFDMAASNVDERSNPAILQFHNDGYYKLNSLKYYGKFDDHRPKQSAYYGGKFYLEGNKIFTEKFYPVSGGKTNKYVKEISKGTIKNDTLRIVVYGDEDVYIRKRYNEIFK